MKIALAQLNYKIGDFTHNKEKIIQQIQKAKEQNADIIVFSELSVCGYPPLDFLENKDFIHKSEETVIEIAKECKGITAIIGAPQINKEPKGKKLYNTAFVLSDGVIQDFVNKTLLPTYDVFDEYRYFEPNTEFKTIQIKDKTIALTVCEDLWDDQPVENSFSRSKLYKTSPLEEIKEDYDIIINIAASPFSRKQEGTRKKVLIENAIKYNKPLIYVNQIGANTNIVFDGESMVIGPRGNLIKELQTLEEDFFIYDTEKEISFKKNNIKKEALLYKAIKTGLKDYFQKMGFKKAVIGLSGGIDSALVAAIAVDAIGKENVEGILMPSEFSSEHSITDAKDLADNLGIAYHIIPIKKIVKSFDESLSEVFAGTEFGIAEENIQARSRGVILMAYSNKFGNIVLNTSNKSEAAVGYSTLYGDMNGSLSILGDVYKTDVFKLAHYINRNQEIIPNNTIVKPPSAELRPDQKDSDSLPDYEILDQILYLFIEKKESKKEIIAKGFDEETVTRTIQMVNNNEYKRFQSPPILRISTKAFGSGRRMPLVAKYDF